jgi:hypothetical protein
MIPQSSVIKGLEWTGPRIPYANREIKGDTYPLTWADDGEIYTAAGDPCWGASHSGLDVEKIIGGPTDYVIEQRNALTDYTGWGGHGPKPSGMICVNGVLYLAFQNLLRGRMPAHGLLSQHGSDAQIVYSSTKGQFWTPALANIAAPMFPGNHFGGPAFINFGQNNAGARDQYVYAVSGDQWDNGSNLRLGRVPADSIMETGQWEFVCAFNPDGTPAWKRALGEAIPVFSLHRQLGLPEMVWLAGLKRYLLFTWTLHGDFDPTLGTDLHVFESPEPWGPFSHVYSEELWEGREFNPYCPRLPLKWVADDGVNLWLQFSGAWSEQGHREGFYRSNVRPFKLLLK